MLWSRGGCPSHRTLQYKVGWKQWEREGGEWMLASTQLISLLVSPTLWEAGREPIPSRWVERHMSHNPSCGNLGRPLAHVLGGWQKGKPREGLK